MTPRVLVVDHRDSFAFILGEQLARCGAAVETVRSTVDLAPFADFLASRDPHLVVLSPGPGGPGDTGVTVPWLRTDPDRPVLGICLGLQALVHACGGTVDRAPEPVHGRAGVVQDLGTELPGNPLAAAWRAVAGNGAFRAARYHSLAVAAPGPVMRPLAVSAGPGGPVPMALGHVDRPWLGLQFHPESVLTPWGGRLIEEILARALASRDRP